MIRTCIFALLVTAAMPALAQKTDWGAKVAPAAGEAFLVPPKTPYVDPSLRVDAVLVETGSIPANMRAIARIGARFGTVTSMHRTPEHNRRVGGVPNSYHLLGRAIDIARRPGVRHAQIAAELRRAGYQLVESLDEGDHSHFAFGLGAAPKPKIKEEPRPQLVDAGAAGQWTLAFAPAGANR